MPIKKNTIYTGTKQFVARVGKATEAAVHEVLTIGARDAAILTPRNTSTLINSQYKFIDVIGKKIIGRVGYRANYSWFVHEAKGTLKGQPRPNNKGNYWDPDAEPKFLEKGFERDGKAEIDQVVRERLRVSRL